MSQPKFIVQPDYDSLHNAAVTMVREVRTIAWIDAVIAPARGGWLFGKIASHKLNVPAISIPYSSKVGAGDDRNHSNIFPELPPNVKTVLLTEDIVDSGNSLKEITEYYTFHGYTVISAAFHWKTGSIVCPDVYYWNIPQDSEFIQYPWERV